MQQERTFTNAAEPQLAALIRDSRKRLVLAAPGITDPVAEALVERITSADPPAQVVVILDADPEVCRLGYGTLSGLEKVTQALESRGLRLQMAPGLRIGLLISDDQTLVYSPTPQLIEAGSNAPEKPNAILLKPDAPGALAAACGLGAEHQPHFHQEIGLDLMSESRLREVKQDLKQNPPKEFDLARRERVFNYALQFVEFKVEHYALGRRSVQLDAGWLGLSDKELKDRFRSAFRLFESGQELEVELPDPAKPGAIRKVSEKTIEQEAAKLRKELITLGEYGTAILKRKKPDFEQRVECFRMLVNDYAKQAKARLKTETQVIRDQLTADLIPGLLANPPQEWRNRSVSGQLDGDQVRELLTDGLERAFAKALVDFEPQVTLVFKDVTYGSIVHDARFRAKLTKHFGAAEIAKLFDEHDAVPAAGTPAQLPLELSGG